MKMFSLIIFSTLLSSAPLFGMGGDKPGPHGGYITMPGPYHVELVEKDKMIRIYLLDIRIKNPIIKNSSAILNRTKCLPKENYFECAMPEMKNSNVKEYLLETVRNNVKGTLAIYKLPLQLH